MQINIPDQTWHDLAAGKITGNFEFLALKILLSRIQLKLKMDASPATLQEAVRELKNLFEKNEQLPKAQADLKKISEGGGVR